MSQTVLDMKATLQRIIHVGPCAQTHPWLVTGSAVAVGFVTGAALTSSPGTILKESRARSKAQLQSGCRENERGTPSRSFLFSILGTVLVGLLKSVAQGFFAAAVIAKTQVDTPSPRHSAEAGALDDGAG